MIQAPSGLSSRGSGRGFFAFTEEGATAPQQDATAIARCAAINGRCAATDTNPSRAHAGSLVLDYIRLSLSLLRDEGI